MSSRFRILLLAMSAILMLLASSRPASAQITIGISSPAADTQFDSGASFDCTGTVTATYTCTYIYLASYDLDNVTVVKSVNANWRPGTGNWYPGTLAAPAGNPPELIDDFKMTADAMDRFGVSQAQATRWLKVKGPVMP